jgi:alkylation response protein AidB-like acyl-CoA dehydrogenase
MHNLDVERIVVAADAAGLAHSAFAAACEYAKSRVQFGHPIAEYQAIRHLLVDMHVAVEAARLLVYRAAAAVDSGQPAAREASVAKYHAGEVVKKVTADAVQVFGGYGFLMDSSVQRFFRDAPVYAIGGGTSQIQKEIIAKQLGL